MEVSLFFLAKIFEGIVNLLFKNKYFSKPYLFSLVMYFFLLLAYSYRIIMLLFINYFFNLGLFYMWFFNLLFFVLDTHILFNAILIKINSMTSKKKFFSDLEWNPLNIIPDKDYISIYILISIIEFFSFLVTLIEITTKTQFNDCYTFDKEYRLQSSLDYVGIDTSMICKINIILLLFGYILFNFMDEYKIIS